MFLLRERNTKGFKTLKIELCIMMGLNEIINEIRKYGGEVEKIGDGVLIRGAGVYWESDSVLILRFNSNSKEVDLFFIRGVDRVNFGINVNHHEELHEKTVYSNFEHVEIAPFVHKILFK